MVPVPGMSDTPPTPPTQFKSAAELTRALRSLGLSKAAAKAVTAGGWSALSNLSGETEPDQPLEELAKAIKAVTEEIRRMNDG